METGQIGNAVCSRGGIGNIILEGMTISSEMEFKVSGIWNGNCMVKKVRLWNELHQWWKCVVKIVGKDFRCKQLENKNKKFQNLSPLSA